MIDYMHDLLEEVAFGMQQHFKVYPEQSPEYTIMTQDLSRQPASSKVLLPDIADIGMAADAKQVYGALQRARKNYQWIFAVFYTSGLGRDKKIKALSNLGVRNKNELYEKRSELHSYLQGLLDSSR